MAEPLTKEERAEWGIKAKRAVFADDLTYKLGELGTGLILYEATVKDRDDRIAALEHELAEARDNYQTMLDAACREVEKRQQAEAEVARLRDAKRVTVTMPPPTETETVKALAEQLQTWRVEAERRQLRIARLHDELSESDRRRTELEEEVARPKPSAAVEPCVRCGRAATKDAAGHYLSCCECCLGPLCQDCHDLHAQEETIIQLKHEVARLRELAATGEAVEGMRPGDVLLCQGQGQWVPFANGEFFETGDGWIDMHAYDPWHEHEYQDYSHPSVVTALAALRAAKEGKDG